MSISDEISRIQDNIDESYVALEEKGAEIPVTRNSDHLASTIRSISGNSLPQTTNCLTEIPQRVKLELNEGVLTLKAGSEIIIPDGFESDGVTKKFIYEQLENDISQAATFNTQHYIFPDLGINNFAHFVNGNTFIQDTQPIATREACCWYDTSANRFKVTNNTGATWNEVNYGLPIAITTSSATGYTSIDVEFKGFGFLKNLFWVEKGVKGLIPNGRNEDGSLNNIEFTTSNTIIKTVSTNLVTNFPITVKDTNFTARNPAMTYDEKANYNMTATGQPFYECFAVEALFTDGVFQWIKPKTTFHAVDFNDISDMVRTSDISDMVRTSDISDVVRTSNISNVLRQTDKAMITSWGYPGTKTTNLTLGASGTTYTAPADGWYYISKNITAIGQYVNLVNESKNYARNITSHTVGCTDIVPVTKGDRIRINYNAAGALDAFRFFYAKGES